MKAIICPKYGSPDVLELQEIKRPSPKNNEALVRIHAAALNGADFEMMRGTWSVRAQGLSKPAHPILGSDVAGRIEEVGSSVQRFKPGDDIWGDLSYPIGYGALAEYVCIPEDALRLKPAAMTFEQAAAMPSAGVVAMQNLRAARTSSLSPILSDKGQIWPGEKVLINGAGGGAGTFAVQIAKSFGAEVTGVDSGEKLEMLRSIGADHVIDYRQEDFTKSGLEYDLIIDTVAHRSVFAYRRALAPEGIFAFIGGSWKTVLQTLLLGPLIAAAGNKKLGLVPWNPNKKEDLDALGELFEAGQVVPVIDKRYPLSQVPEAMRYLEEGHALGKVVINVAENG